jgi:predicted permease
MNTLLNDIRYALRQLSRSPGFAVTAVLTLALGIGALTTVATWTNAILYNPWPTVSAPRNIRFIDATVLGSEGYSVHYDQSRFLRAQGRSFSDELVLSLTTVSFAADNQQPQAIAAGTVSSNYFQFLGIRPEIGRFFEPVDDERAYGAHDEVVLSDGMWRESFAANPGVIGRTVQINHHAFNVIGVAPAGFAGIYGGLAEAAWVPLSAVRDLSADPPPDPLLHYGLQEAVRLRPGISDQTAAAELHTLARSFALQQHSDKYNGWDLNLRDAAHFERGLFGTIGEQIPVLFGASVLLMLLVCINIASLLGQHAAQRRREVAIRTALGATPGRIAAQVMAETGILALAGALTGWAASVGLSRALYLLLPNFGIPLSFNLQTDVRILSFVTAVSVVVALACGLYPVRQSLRISQKEALHEGGAAVAGGSRNKFGQRILLGLQLGMCFVVLVCCGLLTRTALNVTHQNVGFDRTNTFTASLDLSRSGYTKDRGLAFEAALLDKLRNAPGVAGATITSHLPMGDSGSGNTQDFKIPGYVPAKSEEMDVVTDFEGPDFFHVMGIPMRAGRDFNAHDDVSSPGVAIVNEPMARHYWPNGDAIGHSVVVDDKPRQIVGIIRNYAYGDPQNNAPDPLLFLPLAQHYESGIFVAVRSRTTAAAAAGELRQAVAALDKSLPLESTESLEDVVGERYQFARIPAELLGVYSISSVLVAMLGLYAVMAYAVIERKREFALRMALGSTRAAIFRLVLSGGAWTAAVGLLTGGLGSIAAVRLLRAILFGVTPFDPISYCAAAVLLLLTVFVSGLAPARRAASIEPMQALRTE